ncbi:hypothetical protein [Halovivax limisalsi]|uniref:hypothetical protein n=1 Tax=Halovivax limisalsi TaxID=1453760 RepID=UPI001FFC81DB|nr:hypothetical protein [Halovivax limisalsi]
MPRSESTDETASPSRDQADPNHGASDGSRRTDDSVADADRADEASSVRSPTDSAWRPTVHDERAIRTTTTVVLGGLSVLVVLFLLSLLPGVDAAGRAFAALGSGVLGVALAATIGYLALVLPRRVRTAFDLPRDVRVPAASALTWALTLVAILTLHRGLASLYGLLDGPTLLYDGPFFLLAIGPVALVARALWRLIDPAASLLSRKLAGSR